MRTSCRIIGYSCLGLLSVSSFIWVVDWLGRWDWLSAFMLIHPHLAQFFHSPLPYLVFTVLAILGYEGQKKIKEPHIVARYTNFRSIPDLHSVTGKNWIAAQDKRPGWDEQRFDWDWFVEVQMVNDSETRTTLDHLKSEITFGPIWKERKFEFKHLEDLDCFDVDMCLNGKGEAHRRRLFNENDIVKFRRS